MKFLKIKVFIIVWVYKDRKPSFGFLLYNAARVLINYCTFCNTWVKINLYLIKLKDGRNNNQIYDCFLIMKLYTTKLS